MADLSGGDNSAETQEYLYIAIRMRICYNAYRLKDTSIPSQTANKNPRDATSGVFYSQFWYGRAYGRRLVTGYLLSSNHLLMRWLTTPAATAIKKDTRTSKSKTPLSVPGIGAVTELLYHKRLRYVIYFPLNTSVG